VIHAAGAGVISFAGAFLPIPPMCISVLDEPRFPQNRGSFSLREI